MTKLKKKVIVNVLTLSRIVAAFLLPFIFDKMKFRSFIILLGLIFLTDCFDGKLSRRWGVQTVGGMILDPLGDKVLAFSCILSLASKSSRMMVLFGLEFIIMIITLIKVAADENSKASYVGKFKSWILSLMLCFEAILLFAPNFLNEFVGVLGFETNIFLIEDSFVDVWFVFTVLVELITVAVYIGRAFKNKKTMKKNKRTWKSLKEIWITLFDEERFLEDRDKPIMELVTK